MMLTHKILEQHGNSDFYGAGIRDFCSIAIQFDCGAIDDLPLGRVEELAVCRAPFSQTVVQFQFTDGPFVDYLIAFVDEIASGEFQCVFVQRSRVTKEWLITPPFHFEFEGERLFLEQLGGFPAPSSDKDQIGRCFWRVLNAFYVIGCSNVELTDNKPPAALNKKRAKAGKLPLFEYKTLVLKVGKGSARSADGGGTHASPRVHLRRGHVRRIDATRRVWVQSCVVGSKHGMVAKDYRVEGGAK